MALAVVVVGCSKPDENHGPCPRPEPSFRLQLTTEQGALPVDTHLTVFYQGKPRPPDASPGVLPHEDYDLLHPVEGNVDVCCRTGAPVQGALPSVPCGLPARVREASTGTEGGGSAEAGRDATVPSRDAAHDGHDADPDGPSSEGDARTDSGGGSSGGATALLCDLWTNGSAEIVVTGSTYPRFERMFVVEDFNECGPVRRDVRVIWTRRDGGQ